MRMINLSACIAALSLVGAAPAMAATFVAVGDSASYQFDGNQPGTSATLFLTLSGQDSVNSIFNFSYTLSNTSDLALNPSSRVRSFAFNDLGVDTSTGSASPTNSSGFESVSFDTNYPDGIGTVDVCVHYSPGSCTGGGEGVLFGAPATGTFTLDYAIPNLTELTLDDFYVRFQSTGLGGQGSGTGIGGEIPDPQGAVPEPSTWAMMLFGFGAVGFALRRRKAGGSQVKLNFA